MKYSKFAVLFFVLFAACDATGPESTERFWLTSYFGQPLPVALGGGLSDPLDPSPQPTICRDSMQSRFIELEAPATARIVTETSVCASGNARTSLVQSGTYTLARDTVNFRIHIGGVVGTMSFMALRSGNQLRQPFTVYTEAQPDGGGVRYLIYEKR